MDFFRFGKRNSRLHMFAFAIRKLPNDDFLFNNWKLQLPSINLQVKATSNLSDTSPSNVAILLAPGSLYLRSMSEQKAIAKFLSLVPHPRSEQEQEFFEKGMITKTGFFKPQGRNKQNQSGNQTGCMLLHFSAKFCNVDIPWLSRSHMLNACVTPRRMWT